MDSNRAARVSPQCLVKLRHLQTRVQFLAKLLVLVALSGSPVDLGKDLAARLADSGHNQLLSLDNQLQPVLGLGLDSLCLDSRPPLLPPRAYSGPLRPMSRKAEGSARLSLVLSRPMRPCLNQLSVSARSRPLQHCPVPRLEQQLHPQLLAYFQALNLHLLVLVFPSPPPYPLPHNPSRLRQPVRPQVDCSLRFRSLPPLRATRAPQISPQPLRLSVSPLKLSSHRLSRFSGRVNLGKHLGNLGSKKAKIMKVRSPQWRRMFLRD